MDQEELEGMIVARLSHPRNGLCHRFQALVEWGRLYNLHFVFQFVVHRQSKLGFLVGDWLGEGSLS
jgi:hypothetical protein